MLIENWDRVSTWFRDWNERFNCMWRTCQGGLRASSSSASASANSLGGPPPWTAAAHEFRGPDNICLYFSRAWLRTDLILINRRLSPLTALSRPGFAYSQTFVTPQTNSVWYAHASAWDFLRTLELVILSASPLPRRSRALTVESERAKLVTRDAPFSLHPETRDLSTPPTPRACPYEKQRPSLHSPHHSHLIDLDLQLGQHSRVHPSVGDRRLPEFLQEAKADPRWTTPQFNTASESKSSFGYQQLRVSEAPPCASYSEISAR